MIFLIIIVFDKLITKLEKEGVKKSDLVQHNFKGGLLQWVHTAQSWRLNEFLVIMLKL